MKYDDASWRYGGEFPAELDETAGATHIAMFAAWCVLNGLSAELHLVPDTWRSYDLLSPVIGKRYQEWTIA